MAIELHIRDQARLWDLFQQPPALGGRWPGKLEVLESGMLRPEKSLLAIFGLTRDLEKARRFARLIPCESCPTAAFAGWPTSGPAPQPDELRGDVFRRGSARRSRLGQQRVQVFEAKTRP